MDWYLIDWLLLLSQCVILFGSSPGKNTYYFTATKRCDILISIDGRKVNLWLDAKRVSKAWYKKCQNNTAHELINTGTLAHKCNASIHHDFSYRTSYQFIENTGELYLVKVTVGYTLLIYYFNTIMIF